MSALPIDQLAPAWPCLRQPWIATRWLPWLQATVRDGPLGLDALVAGLQTIGARIQALIRAPWRARQAPVDARADAEAAALWQAWAAGDFWSIQPAWERAYLMDGTRAFLAVAEATHRRPRLRLDVMESFFQVGWDAQGGPAGWRKILCRVVESEGPAPFGNLVAAFPAAQRRAALATVFNWGTRAETTATLLPEIAGAEARAHALAARAEAAPDALLDAHVASRLVSAWCTSGAVDLEHGWRVALQNDGRARSRLRALLAAAPTPPAPREAGLHARTRFAVRRFFRDWARAQRPDFPLGDAAGVDPVRQAAAMAAPFDGPAQAALRCWILLGALRGHLPSLHAWRSTRRTAGRTAAFYRYLNTLPPVLLRPRAGDRAGRERVRIELIDSLDEHLDALRPLLGRVAALRAPRLAERLSACLAPAWVAAVPLPRGRTHQYVEHAARACRAIDEAAA